VTDKEDSELEYCPSEHSSILTEANSDKDKFLNKINGVKDQVDQNKIQKIIQSSKYLCRLMRAVYSVLMMLITESTDKDLLQSLSGEAREIAKKYVRFTVRGKLTRTVPVLLSAPLLQCIELILKYRNNARVPAENPYLFGILGFNKFFIIFKYLNACELMQRFSTECDA